MGRGRLRLMWRSLGRLTGLQFWMLFYGLPMVTVFAAFCGVCGATLGWQLSYEIALAIKSPADVTTAPALAWMLSVTGWLLAPGIAGAVAGYVVTVQIDGRRSKLLTDLLPQHLRPQGELHKLIPTLQELHGYRLERLDPSQLGGLDREVEQIPEQFAYRWIALHHEDPALAQDHWEQIVTVALNDAAVVGKAAGVTAIRRAVTAALTLVEHSNVRGSCWIGKSIDHVPASAPGLADQHRRLPDAKETRSASGASTVLGDVNCLDTPIVQAAEGGGPQ